MYYSIRNIVIGTVAVLAVVLLILFITYNTLLAQEKEQANIQHARLAMQKLEPALEHVQALELLLTHYYQPIDSIAGLQSEKIASNLTADSVAFTNLSKIPVQQNIQYLELAQSIYILKAIADTLTALKRSKQLSTQNIASLTNRSTLQIEKVKGDVRELEQLNRESLNASYTNSVGFTRKTFDFIEAMLVALIALLLIGVYLVYRDIQNSKRLAGRLTQFKLELEQKVQEQTAQIKKEKNISDTLIESLPGVFFLQDSEGNYIRWNRELENLTGYSSDEIARMNAMEFFSDDQREIIINAIQRVIEKGFGFTEAVVTTKDKRQIPFYFSGQYINYEGRDCVIGTGIDITYRKKVEEENENVRYLLRERIKELSTLYKVSQVLQTNDKAVGELLQEIVNLLPSGWQYSEMTAARITFGEKEYKTFNFGRGNYSQFSDFISNEGIAGAVEVVYLHPLNKKTTEVFLKEEKDLINMLAGMIKNAIDKKTEAEELKQSEANLHTIFDTTDIIYVLMDNDFRVISYNKRAVDFTSHELKQDINSIRNNFMNYFSAEREAVLTQWIRNARPGNHVSYEISYAQSNGSLTWYAVKMFPITVTGEKIFGLMLAIADITSQKRMEQEMLDHEIQGQKTITREVLKAQENERNKIGQELHDNVNQILASTKLYLNMAYSDHPNNPELIKQSMQFIDDAIAEIRLLSSKEVTPLKEIKLKDLIQSLVDTLNYNSTIEGEFHYSFPENLTVDEDLKLNIYRIIQEQINNIIKHSRAKRLHISIRLINNFIFVLITDDGIGFDPTQTRKGIGISNMINRVESYNGELTITSSRGNGCEVEIKIPCC